MLRRLSAVAALPLPPPAGDMPALLRTLAPVCQYMTACGAASSQQGLSATEPDLHLSSLNRHACCLPSSAAYTSSGSLSTLCSSKNARAEATHHGVRHFRVSAAAGSAAEALAAVKELRAATGV